jgi:hypothetical protein
MSGYVLDVVVFWVLGLAVRTIRFVRSMRWVRTTVQISRTVVLEPFWGCPSVQVYYRTGSNRRSQEEYDEVPFLMRLSARNYASNILANQRAIVRMNSANRTEMFFFEFDQQ